MTDLQPLNDGIAEADGPEKTREYADVTKWMERVGQARKFDEDARKQYAKDRRYARGDSGFQVDANIVGTFIDISESFLYAKQPDVDVLPAKSCEPPGLEALMEAAEQSAIDHPEVAAAGLAAGREAAAQATYTGMPQENALQAGQIAQELAEQSKQQEMVQAEFERLQKHYAQRQRDAKAFAETLELVIGQKWSKANLKKRGRRCVRSGLTVGLGVIMASWQERTAPSPETTQAINDLQANIKRAAMQRENLAEGSPGTELDAQMAEYQRQLETLRQKPEAVVSRQFVTDVVAPEDFVVAPGYAISDHLDAPWNARRIPMLASDAQASFDLTKEKIGQATRYHARKPKMVQDTSASRATDIEATDADAYVSGAMSSEPGESAGGDWVMVLEIWDRDTNTVLTGIEGMKCWAKAAWRPTATSRFYPFFVFAVADVDAQRHPQSLVTRSIKLVDEYNRIGSAEAEHRRRVIPKTMFNAGAMAEGEANKLATAVTQEMVAIKTTLPKADLRGLLTPVTYAAIDAALYDRSRVINELERIWGVQEALSGGIQVDKTATEAEIQQSGFQARMGGRRDLLDAMLSDLATYTAELLRAHLTIDDVVAIVGPGAFWPEYTGPNDLDRFVSVEIRAGSSGKPNTAAERQAMATLLPILQNGITMIGQLRQALPTDLADAHAKLMQLVIERSGERIDLDALLPKAPAAQPVIPGMPVPGAPIAAATPESVPTGEPPVEPVAAPVE